MNDTILIIGNGRKKHKLGLTNIIFPIIFIHRKSMYEMERMTVKINQELRKGSTSILILSLLEKEDMYGYQITQELKKATEHVFELKEGTLYPMLHSLEKENAIESYWFDAENGKRRKYYKITRDGKKLLKSKKEEWLLYTRAVNTVLGYNQ